jgi:hypothetical protein
MTPRAWVGWAFSAGFLALNVAGCSGSSNDDDDDGGGNGVGTASCAQWQTGICDFIQRCGGDPTSCRDQAPAIACSSDAEAERCADEFENATCDGTFPAGCDLTEIVDPAPAVAKCNTFVETVCNRSEECEPGSKADCVADVDASLDCASALGAKPAYDQCIMEIAVIECTASAGPASCQGVFLF